MFWIVFYAKLRHLSPENTPSKPGAPRPRPWWRATLCTSMDSSSQRLAKIATGAPHSRQNKPVMDHGAARPPEKIHGKKICERCVSEHLSTNVCRLFFGGIFIWGSWQGNQRSMADHCNQLLAGTAAFTMKRMRYEWRNPAPKIDTLERMVFQHVYIYINWNIHTFIYIYIQSPVMCYRYVFSEAFHRTRGL